MIENVFEFAGDLGIDIVKSSLQDLHNSRKIRKDIIDFAEHYQESFLKSDSFYNEIDYQGYLDYVRQTMLNEIKIYICTVDYKEAENLKQKILAKALTYEKKLCYQDGCILFITENCINIVKKYYVDKLDGNNQLLAHITVQTILETVVPKLDMMQEDINQIKDLMNRKIFTDNDMENGNSICLIYCKGDMDYTEEIKKSFVENSITYNECCYEDEYSENKDAISYLKENKILILFIGESFLKNIHCVYGLDEVTKNENAKEYIFPIIIDRSIFSERNRIERIAYWEFKENELRRSVEELEKVQHAHSLISENLVKYERTAQSIDEVIVWVSKHSYSTSDIKEIIKKKPLS